MQWKAKSGIRIVFGIAGTFALVGAIGGFLWSPFFLLLPALVGTMQILFALTGLCPALFFLKKMGFEVAKEL